jgi:hypothetical protein
MKTLLYALLLSPILASAASTSMRDVQTCRLEDGSEAILQAQHDPERDADRFYVMMNGKSETAFTDMPDADYAGQIVLSQCLENVLIFAISYGAPYHKGVVIRRNTESRTTHRIDFSEKALPELLYLGKKETKLVVPNMGHEVPAKYLLYSFQVDEGQPEEASGIDRLPSKIGFKVLRVKQ